MPMYVAKAYVSAYVKFYVKADTEEQAEQLVVNMDPDDGQVIDDWDVDIQDLDLMNKPKEPLNE